MQPVIPFCLSILLCGVAYDTDIPRVPPPSVKFLNFLRSTQEELDQLAEQLINNQPMTQQELFDQFRATESCVKLQFRLRTLLNSLQDGFSSRSRIISLVESLETDFALDPQPYRSIRKKIVEEADRALFPELAVRPVQVTVQGERCTAYLLTPGRRMTSFLAPTDLLVINDHVQQVNGPGGQIFERRFLGRAAFDNLQEQTRLAISLDAKLIVDPLVKEAVMQLLSDGFDDEELIEGLPNLSFTVAPQQSDREGLELLAAVVTGDVIRFSMMLNQEDGRQAIALENLCSTRGLPITLVCNSADAQPQANLTNLRLTLARRTHALQDDKSMQVLTNSSPFPAEIKYYLFDDQVVIQNQLVMVNQAIGYKNLNVNPFSLKFPAEGVLYPSLKATDVLDKEFYIEVDGFSVDRVHIINKLANAHPVTNGKLLYVEVDVKYTFTPNDPGSPSSDRVAGTFKLAPFPAVGHDVYVPFPKRDRPGRVEVEVMGKASYEDAVRSIRLKSDGTVVRIIED